MQALTDTQIKQMKSDLRARLDKVTSKYFKERNESATVKDHERFINTTICYEYIKHENNCFTVRISAKADDTIQIVHNDPISITVTGACAAAGSLLGSAGSPLGTVAGAAAGAAVGAAFKSMVGGVRDDKDSFTAEEIFQLLETDGLEKQDEWVKCTVRLT